MGFSRADWRGSCRATWRGLNAHCPVGSPFVRHQILWKDGGAAGIDRTLKYKISDSSGGSPEAEQINAASTTTTHYTQPPPQPSASKCNQRGFYMLANADTAVLLTTERVAHPCSHVRKQMPLPSPTGLAAPPPWAMGPLGNILRRLSIHRTQGLDLGSIYLVNLVIS